MATTWRFWAVFTNTGSHSQQRLVFHAVDGYYTISGVHIKVQHVEYSQPFVVQGAGSWPELMSARVDMLPAGGWFNSSLGLRGSRRGFFRPGGHQWSSPCVFPARCQDSRSRSRAAEEEEHTQSEAPGSFSSPARHGLVEAGARRVGP